MGVFPGPAYGALKAGEPVQIAGKSLASPLLHACMCMQLQRVGGSLLHRGMDPHGPVAVHMKLSCFSNTLVS